jgi:hypothetical protein
MKSCLLVLMLLAQVAGAWQVELTATGQTGPTPYVFTVTVGDSLVQSFLLAPPRPPQYATYAELYEPEWSSGPYLAMLYDPSTNDTLTWLLQVDPNGNLIPPIARTTTISWNQAALPMEGNLAIVEYLTGNTVVTDMRSQSSFEVAGTEDQYFNILWITSSSATPIKGDFQPTGFSIKAIQPNPFNPSTVISIALAQAGPVKLSVYDGLGRQVAVLMQGWHATGEHQVTFQGTSLSAGIYFLRLQMGSLTASRKMVLLK